MYDVIIIGAGVVGAACAYELSKYDLNLCVLEANNDVANGTSKANSAIVHAGYDPHPGTRMARLNVEGNRLMEPLCRKLDVPFRRVGSHVLAFSEQELSTLRALFARGEENGVPGLRLLTGAEARAMEPNLSDAVCGSLYAPSAGIVSPWELTLALMETAIRNGAQLQLCTPVTAISKTDSGAIRLQTPNSPYETRFVLAACGAHCAAIARMAGDRMDIQPNRGEYYLLDKSEGTRVHSVIFQCPNENGKGVLVAPTVHGNLIVGPNAAPVQDPDDTRNTAEALSFVRQMALKSVPSVNFRENIRNFAGVRANHAGDDFMLMESAALPCLYHLAGIKSPGLSSAPAIAREAVSWLSSKLPLREKASYVDSRRHIRFQELSMDERNALIRENPLYGCVICRCETVTEGEIVDAIHSPIPATTINAVKRRTGAGMGRCQSGFCGPRVQEILARELGCAMEDVLLDAPGSYILTGETKGGGAQ